MSEKDTGGPAYPSQALSADGAPARMLWEGMTLRDYFAGQALAGELSAGVLPKSDINALAITSMCYKIADAMIQERNK